MVCILRFDCKRILLFIVIATLSSIFFVFSVSASVTLFSSAVNPFELTDGIYNIVNRQTGEYLDVFDIIYDPEGKAYLANKTGQDGQDFLVKRQDDGTYILYPRSEKGIFSLSYEFDIMEGEFISKTSTVTNQSKFSIVPITSNDSSIGYYTIKPACMSDNMLSLGISSLKGPYGFSMAGLALENGSLSQQWDFVKVSSETLTILGGYVNVRMGTTHDIYAKLTPEYLIGNMVWESSNPEIATVDPQGIVHGVAEGSATITVTCGNQTASTIVRVTDLPAYTWYSQHNMYTGGWDAVSLKNIYFTTFAGNRKLFFAEGYKTVTDWMDMGCKLCSEAMVLHNMGATLTTGYDLRSGEENNLDADPYTVAIANSGATGHNINTTRVANNPVLVDHHLIDPRFTVNGKTITSQEFYGKNLKHIKELLDAHPEGVVVGMYNNNRDTTHYVVFTECLNPDDPYFNFEFRICDPAASDESLGDNVPFKESISYRSLGYGYWSIFEYSVYNIVEE